MPPTVECIETWHGQDVLDGTGEKAGRLEEVYYDPTTHEPLVLLMKHGMLGRQVTLLPALEVVLSHDYLRVPYGAEQIERAEGGSADDELSGEQVAAVGAAFNLTFPSSGPLYSARLIARRRAEAEEADRRARELEAEAEQRASELDTARMRANEAAEEAAAAEREREKAKAANLEAGNRPPSRP
jgi:hypothetical protein